MADSLVEWCTSAILQ